MFVNHPFTKLCIAALGGGYVSFFMTRLSTKALRRNAVGFIGLLAQAGLRGIVSTTLAFETFYVFASVYLAVFLPNELHPTAGQKVGMSLLWFISIQTYGIYPIALVLGFSVLYGLLAGAAILWVRTREQQKGI